MENRNFFGRHYGDIYSGDKYAKMRIDKCYDLIFSELKKGTKILDVGGYEGDLLEKINTEKGKNFVDYHIVDHDVLALKVAEKRGAKVFCFDLGGRGISEIFAGEKFDVAICTEVLEHLVRPEKMLQEMRDLLSDEGACVISLPNENTIFHRIYALLGLGIDQYAFGRHKHLHFPTIRQNRDFVASVFEIKKTVFYVNPGGKGSRMGWAAKLLGLIPDAIWNGLANFFPGLFARGVIFLVKKKKLTEDYLEK